MMLIQGATASKKHASRWAWLLCAWLPLLAAPASAGNQQYEELSASVKSIMSQSIYSPLNVRNSFDNLGEAMDWLSNMQGRLEGRWDKRLPQPLHFLQLVHYEAKRAGVDPQLVLSIIQVESGFNPFAVSSASARGMMQVMPFWVKEIGEAQHNLFDIETNIRYGCTILRHYLDLERGNLFRALGRYNGSTGRAEYPNLVMGAYRKNWQFTARTATEGNIKLSQSE